MSPPDLQKGRDKNPTLELKLISANDVCHINVSEKMDVYAVVSITGDNPKKQTAKTPIDFYGGSNPTWNHTVKFFVNEEPSPLLTLKVKLFSYWLEDEDDLYLGEVNVSAQALLSSNPLTNDDNGEFKLVTYPVKIMERTEGMLSLSYRFNKAASTVDLYPSAPDYSLLSDQPDYPNQDPESSSQPVMYSPQIQTTMTKLNLVVVIKSAKDIKSGSIGNNMNVYASVIIREGTAKIKDTINTPIAYCAYRNPRWDHEVQFSLDEKLVRKGRLTLVVKLVSVRPILGEHDVGEINVPIQELFELHPPSPYLLSNVDVDDNDMSLETRGVSVNRYKEKGTLSFMFKFLMEQAPQPFIMYPIHGTSGYTIAHPGAHSGPINDQLPIYMPPQNNQPYGYQQYSQPQVHKLHPQIQPHYQPPQPQSRPYQQRYVLPPQPQLEPPPLAQQLPPTKQETQTQGAQGGKIAALGLGAAILGRVVEL